jgi:hypothetical protein
MLKIKSFDSWKFHSIHEVVAMMNGYIYKTKDTGFFGRYDDPRILKSKYVKVGLSTRLTKQPEIDINLAPDDFYEPN